MLTSFDGALEFSFLSSAKRQLSNEEFRAAVAAYQKAIGYSLPHDYLAFVQNYGFRFIDPHQGQLYYPHRSRRD
jgi:hypothetical protein